MRGRRGFTLVELLIGLTLSAIIGVFLMKLLITGTRFTEQVDKGREARGVARTPLNLLTSELRMTNAQTGVLSASSTQITLRVPFMYGIACLTTTGSSGTLSGAFLPVDTTMAVSSLGFTGFAIRQFDGSYAYSPSTSSIPTGTGISAACSTAGVTMPSNSRFGTLVGNISTLASAGTPVFLYRTVKYEFATSNILSGRTALWRRITDASGNATSSEELAAPFDSTAKFRFFILNNRVASDTLPSQLADLRGLEISLPGQSEGTARQRSAPEKTSLITSVLFLNRLD